MSIRGYRFAAVAVALLIVAGPTAAAAQAPEPPDVRARALYEAAAYEDALAVLGDATQPEAQQYRVLCLLALGRQSEAKAALDALVTAAPDFAVSEDMPPRFVTMLAQVREQLLPSMLRGLLTEGRQQYQRQEYEQARARFERIVALTSHPALNAVKDATDLRLLAEGYVDLLRDVQPQPRTAPEPTVAAAASPPVPEVRTPPSAVRQSVPSWPADAGQIDRARVGLLRVRIGATGEVLAATVIRSVHPRYDWQLLAAARKWQYLPATLNGVAVESESTIEIRPEPSSR